MIVSNEVFLRVLDRRLRQTRLILDTKAREYTDGPDRMHNFNVAARINDVSSEQALWGMYLKHLVSVMDLVKWASASPKRLTVELVDEKIGDSINYHILLEAMLLTRVAKENNETGS